MKLYVAVICLLMGLSAFAQAPDGLRDALSADLKASGRSKSASITSAQLRKALDIYSIKHPHDFEKALLSLLDQKDIKHIVKNPGALAEPIRKAKLLAAKDADPEEMKAYLLEAKGVKSNYVGFLSEHYGSPDSSNQLLRLKTKTHPEREENLRTLIFRALSDGRIFVGLKGQNGHGLTTINREELVKKVSTEMLYLTQQYHVQDIKKKCSCSIEYGIGDRLREKYDQLVVMRDMLEGKSSSDHLDSLDLYWAVMGLNDIVSDDSKHVDRDLDSNQLKQFLENQSMKKLQQSFINLHQGDVQRQGLDNFPAPKLPLNIPGHKGKL
jgi:hypothetical protein